MLLSVLVRIFALAILALSLLPTAARAQTDLSGLWTGKSSGNQVTIEMRSGGFTIMVAGQRREGQYGDGQFFRDAGGGLYLYTKPDGDDVKAQVLAPDSLRVTNPDGWTDVFTRPPRAAATVPPPVAARTQTDLSGLWTGEASGNQVRLEMRSGGFAQMLAGTQNAGQRAGEFFFRDAGAGLYLHTKADGNDVRVQVLGPDRIRVTNPDGWTDVFTRPSTVVASSPPGPAPAIVRRAEELPPARSAKITAPWSPKAIATSLPAKLSPQFAAERADALVSCVAPIKQFIATGPLTPAEVVLNFESFWLADADMGLNVDGVRNKIAAVDHQIASGTLDAGTLAARRAGRCLHQRRLAQLEGSPLIGGAVEGSLTPLSIGGAQVKHIQEGKDARIIASDGKSAMDCVKLFTLTSTDSNMGTGGRVIANQCGGPVEITWCYTDTECSNNRGAMWTVGAGSSWPVSTEREIRWAACHGRNTVSFVKGTAGLRYYCSAPAKE